VFESNTTTRVPPCWWTYVKFFLIVLVVTGPIQDLGASDDLKNEREEITVNLEGAIEITLETHPLMKAAQARVEAARGASRQAGAYPNPSVGLFYSRLDREITSGVRQSLEFPLKTVLRREVAQQGVKVSETEMEKVKLELIFQVKKAFYGLLLAQKNLEATRGFLRSTETLKRITERKFEEGDVPEFEVIKADVEHVKAQKEVEKAVGEVEIAKVVLNALLSRAPTAPLEVKGELSSPVGELKVEELLDLAEKKHPDILIQRHIIERQGINVTLVKSSLIPNIDVVGNISHDQVEDRSKPEFGVSISLPLWDRKGGAIDEAKAKKLEAEAQMRFVLIEIYKDVVQAFQSWSIARGQVEAFEKGLLQRAAEAKRIAERSYEIGESEILDVIDAERTFLTTAKEYDQSLFDLQLAVAGIERAVGMKLY